MKRIVYIKKCGYNDYARVTFVHKISCNKYPWWIPEKVERISKYCYYKQNPLNRFSFITFDKKYLCFPDFSRDGTDYFYNKILKYGEEY